MKKICSLTVFIVISILLNSQGKSKTGKNDPLKELQAINKQFIRNFLANDTPAHNKIIHPGRFLFIGTNGKLSDRNTYMKEWAHGYDPSRLKDFIMVEEQIRVFGNMAIIVAKTPYKRLQNDIWVEGATRYSDTYIREGGKWQCVQVQLTPITSD